MTVVTALHRRVVAGRRVRRLATLIAERIPHGARVLDIGTGDGALAHAITDLRPDITLTAVETLVRPNPRVPTLPYDGRTLPFPSASFDCALLVDVLHHDREPVRLLAEAGRIAGRVVLKDHLADGFGARVTLRCMDWVGNAGYGVALPYTYWTRREWVDMLESAGLVILSWTERLRLYPMPAALLCDRALHVLAVLGHGR